MSSSPSSSSSAHLHNNLNLNQVSNNDSDHSKTPSYTHHLSSLSQSSPIDLESSPLCRVCRSDDPSLGPLFHPCRCTGSIAHVHQDCLSTWLTHSKKSSCELCGHAFTFENVYKPGSPKRPPLATIIYQAINELGQLLLLVVRASLVAICWLGVVPYIVLWVSTAYWKAGDWFAMGLTSNTDLLYSQSHNRTASSHSNNQTSQLHLFTVSTTNQSLPIIHFRPPSILSSLNLDLNSIALDIFQGQLITCAVILSFVIVFLLREWILQNTPPADVMHADEDPLPPPPLPVLVEPLRVPEPDQPRPPHLTQGQSLNFLTSLHERQPFKLEAMLHQFSPTPDPSDLSKSFDTLVDPLDLDMLSHQLLVTSAYLLFVAEPSQRVLPHLPSPSTTDPTLLQTWSQLATIFCSDNPLPHSIQRLRLRISWRSMYHVFSDEEYDTYNNIELDWTTSLLTDPKLTKHLQSLYNIPDAGSQLPLPVVHHHGLIYSLLTVYLLIESREFVEDTPDGGTGYSEVCDALRLFVVPLVSDPVSVLISPSLNQLELDIQALAQTYQAPHPDQHPSTSTELLKEMKADIVSILVRRRVLDALISSPAFVKYAHDMLHDPRLFADQLPQSHASRSERPDLHSASSSESLSLSLHSTLATEPTRTISIAAEKAPLIPSQHLHHRLLVTSVHLLLLPQPSHTTPSALQAVNFENLAQGRWCQRETVTKILELWSQLATSAVIVDEASATLQSFRQYVARPHPSSSASIPELTKTFHRLENEWIAILLDDELIARFVLSLFTSQPRQPAELSSNGPFESHLLLTYTQLGDLLKTKTDARDLSCLTYDQIYNHLQEQVTTVTTTVPSVGEGSDEFSTRLLEIKRATQFLLSSCQPATLSGDPPARLHDLACRMRRGIIGILARQQLLHRLVGHERFVQYAHAMLTDETLFESDEIGVTLDDDNALKAALESVDPKGKHKAIDPPPSSTSITLAHALEPSRLATLHDPSPVGAFNWLEAGEELPRLDEASSVQASVDEVQTLPPRTNASELTVPPVADPQGFPLAPPAHVPAVDPREFPLIQAHLHNLNAVQNLQAGLDRGGFGGLDEMAEGGGNVGGEDELMAEDLDGILELIGMKGSLLMLAQNVGLMTMLLSLSILAFVHLPHVIGKIAVLSRAHRLLVPPLKGLFILRKIVHRLLDYLSVHFKHLLTRYDMESKWTGIISSIRLYSRNVRPSRFQWLTQIGTRLHQSIADPVPQARLAELMELSSVWFHEAVDQLCIRLDSIAYGSKPIDRVLAVILGYAQLICLSLVYLSSGLDQQRARFVSETIVNGMRQQVLIGKVGMFIFVELVIFPFLCGLLLNLTTIPVFPGVSVSSRLDLYWVAPYSTILLTWLAGTCFMFTFAILVSTCRESLRPGVCWWIRDPSDDRFNPIREILERPTWSQVKKICASAVMYGTVIVFGLGAVVANLIWLTGSLPLRIHLDRPLSASALDLVAYQTLLPLFLHWADPRAQMKTWLQKFSRRAAHALRLSCYLYGERVVEEETRLEVVVRQAGDPSQSWAIPLGSEPELTPGVTIERRRKLAGGSFARVPATDSVKVVPGRKMHVAVGADGVPVDPADAALVAQQLAEGGAEDYTVVYLPPLFRARMILYVIAMWAAAVGVGWLAVSAPLMLGRVVFDRILIPHGREPHDVYAYALGAVLMAVRPLRISWHGIWFVIGAGIVLPLLSAAAMELYVLGPLRARTTGIPTIYLLESWAYGCLYLSIAGRLIRVVPSWITRTQDEVLRKWRAGEMNEGLREANLNLIIPLIWRSILVVIVPGGLMTPMVMKVIPKKWIEKLVKGILGWEVISQQGGGGGELERGMMEIRLIRSIYPAILSWYSHYVTSRVCAKGVRKWIEKVRDQRFLELRRLKNYDPVGSMSTTTTTTPLPPPLPTPAAVSNREDERIEAEA